MNSQEAQTIWKLTRMMKNAGLEMKSPGHAAVITAIADAVGRMEIDAMINNANEINVEALKRQIYETVKDVTPEGISIEIEEMKSQLKKLM